MTGRARWKSCPKSVLKGEIKGLSDNDILTVGNTVMKQLKTIKVGTTNDTSASMLLSVILDESWPIAIP